jgi:hypothetical protein
MANNLNDIVRIEIDINSPVVDSASFDNILLFGAPPVNPAVSNIPAVGTYNSLDEVTGLGYKATGSGADPVGEAARVKFSNSSSPLVIAVRQYVEETTELEPVIDTLTRALDYDGWWCACEAGIDTDDFEECAQLIETREKVFAYTFLTSTDPVSGIYFRSIGVCGLGTDKENAQNPPENERYKHVAYAAQPLKYHAGSETWANKTVSAVEASDYTGTLKAALESGHSNWTQEIGGKNVTRNGQVRAGEWIDTIRFRDWLKNDMQIRIANLLLTNPKIPYTDPGIALVENQMIASLKAGRGYGGIAPDQFDDEGVLYPGFTTSVPLAMSLTESQRYSRKLVDCKFTARLAGAIHLVEVHGSLVY